MSNYAKQVEQYREYIKEHIENVNKVWRKVSNTFKGEHWIQDAHLAALDELIEKHDQSKYGDKEFDNYRQWFFPVVKGIKSKLGFNYGWNHHQKSNPHHWQYWLMWEPEGTSALPMEFNYIIEMLSDWSGMSLKFGDIPSEFYQKEKSNMLLHPKTVSTIEDYLPYFDEAVKDLRKEEKQSNEE